MVGFRKMARQERGRSDEMRGTGMKFQVLGLYRSGGSILNLQIIVDLDHTFYLTRKVFRLSPL